MAEVRSFSGLHLSLALGGFLENPFSWLLVVGEVSGFLGVHSLPTENHTDG